MAEMCTETSNKRHIAYNAISRAEFELQNESKELRKARKQISKVRYALGFIGFFFTQKTTSKFGSWRRYYCSWKKHFNVLKENVKKKKKAYDEAIAEYELVMK